MKSYRSCLVIALVVVLGIFAFFYYFGHRDDTALAGFSAAYAVYDRAIAAAAPGPGSAPAASNQADAALADLRAKASARISSLTRNDGELMQLMPEIADLAGKELDALKAYRQALAEKNANTDSLAKAFSDWTVKRQAAYARFQALESPK
ncbi:MAG TPA: hypothetical protein VF806_02875 [Anaerolineaceae bacterium]